MFCVLGDEKINAGLIARAGPGAERKDNRMGMRPCHFRVGSGDHQILQEEQLQLIAVNRKKLELVLSRRFVWIL